MSLLRLFSRRVVKSLYASVLIATLLILLASFLVFRSISDQVFKASVEPVYGQMDRLQIEEARDRLREGGKPALEAYMKTLDRAFNTTKHSLLDANGIDLVTGEDKSRLLPASSVPERRMESVAGSILLVHRSQDGQVWFIAVGPTKRDDPRIFLPYYFLVIGATGVLFWLVAVGVVSPLRTIAGGIARFGEGDLSTRVEIRREDEIGQLARSFNDMAARLGLLIESERTFLGDISHELRSPLARLKMGVKLARTAEDKGASLDRIERDVDRLTSILSDVVEITLVEGDPALKVKGRVDLQKIVETVVHDCELEARARECFLSMEGRLSRPVEGNPELLRRAVENVVRNAVRHAPNGSMVGLEVSELEEEAVISVRDYGTGVPEEALTRIFDPFFRVEKARDAKTGGSGLGLAIAKRAVLLHRGKIFAQNALPGLAVTLQIPLIAVETGTVAVARA